MTGQSPSIKELQKQKKLLEIEYAAEKEEFRKQTELIGLKRKIKRGDAWFPVRIGNSNFNSLNQLTLEIFRENDVDIEHNFEYGRPVLFFSIKETPDEKKKKDVSHISYFSFSCKVSYVESNRMVVIIPDNRNVFELQTEQKVGLQLSFDETTYQTMMNALDKVINAEDNRLAYLRNLFYSHHPAERFSFASISMPGLNLSQEKAVNDILHAKDVMIVHGPPGTGKTTTLVEAIYETLKREPQVLVCAQSNMAVDWISERLTDHGINVLRIGNPTRVNDKMLSFTYERQFENHPDYPLLWAIRQSIRRLRQNKREAKNNFHQKMEHLKARQTELEIRINTDLFNRARVIASTLTGAANRILAGQKYGTLFIDEAAQALEAACWIPIRKVSRVIFAGDHCQLPPTVKSFEALKGGLGKTLMERIVENKPEVVSLLSTQYRMNEHIMKFSSNWFYDGKVKTAPEVGRRSILDFDVPMQWIDTSDMRTEGNENAFKEQFVNENYGRINKFEAELSLQTLKEYFTKIGRNRLTDERIDVGIISPYRAQVQYLRQIFKGNDFFKPYRKAITINTIDGFQGQERDIILISLVRSNEKGEIGFLRDLRRMNVAMTRARMKLIIIGNATTLKGNAFYNKLFNYIQNFNQHASTGLYHASHS